MNYALLQKASEKIRKEKIRKKQLQKKKQKKKTREQIYKRLAWWDSIINEIF